MSKQVSSYGGREGGREGGVWGGICGDLISHGCD